MKKNFLILAILVISVVAVKGQNIFYTCVINFEDNPCWEASYFNVDIPSSKHMWQVAVPNKTVFDSAWSAPKAILTDSAGSYPVNDTSGFIIKFLLPEYCECAPVIGAHYKIDSDSLRDFGLIEYSVDHGSTWLNVLSDTVIPDVYWITPRPVLTGRIHQWSEFHAFVPEYIRNDTLYYRFTFISDSVQTNQDGWMLDDIELVTHTEGIPVIGSQNEINIYPNPAAGAIMISAKTFLGEMEVSVFDILGQLRLQQKMDHDEAGVDISGLGQGLYMVKVRDSDKYVVKRIIKE